MKIAIIGAMEEEVSLLIERLEGKQQQIIHGFEFHTGQLQGKEIVILKSGIGKVTAAVGATVLAEHFQPDCIINTGSAAGLKPNCKIGDVIISNAVTYFDVDVTGFGYKPGQVPGMPEQFTANTKLISKATAAAEQVEELNAEVGLIISGDSFVNDANKVAEFLKIFPNACALEMEAGAIAQACHLLEIPFVIVRAVSDSGDGDAKLTHEEFLAIAAKSSAQMVLALVKSL
jgi:adenosylhomocysteine nucleosidase